METVDRPARSASATITIAAPPNRVYEWVSDVPRMARFSPECERCEWTEGVPGTVASRFKGFNRLGPLRWWTEGRITVADQDVRFAYKTSAGFEPRDFPVTEWEYTLESHPNGTRVREQVTILVLLRLARHSPLLVRLRIRQLQRGMAKTLERLKAEVESEAG